MTHIGTARELQRAWKAFRGPVVSLSLLVLLSGFARPALANPQLVSFDIEPCNLAGGLRSQGSVVLSSPATAPTVVQITNRNAAAVVPASVTVPQGATTANFTVVTLPVTQKVVGSIFGTLDGISQYMTLTVRPVSVQSASVAADYVYEGSGTMATITLETVSPYDTQVTLQSDTPAVVGVPAGVVIPAGTTSITLPLQCNAVAANTRVILTATANELSRTTTLTVRPLRIQTFTLSAASTLGGSAATGTVTLAGPAPASGKTIALSSNVASVTLPASVVVSAGQTSVQFSVGTSAVATNTPVTLEATVPGMNAFAGLLVHAPGVLSISLPASVKSGASATGTVTLDSPATTGGATIQLVSDNTQAATVVATIVIPAGQTVGTFTLQAKAVSANTTVNITASANGVSKSAPIVVTP